VSTLLHCDAATTANASTSKGTASTCTAIAEASIGTAKASTGSGKSKRHAPDELQNS